MKYILFFCFIAIFCYGSNLAADETYSHYTKFFKLPAMHNFGVFNIKNKKDIYKLKKMTNNDMNYIFLKVCVYNKKNKNMDIKEKKDLMNKSLDLEIDAINRLSKKINVKKILLIPCITMLNKNKEQIRIYYR